MKKFLMLLISMVFSVILSGCSLYKKEKTNKMVEVNYFQNEEFVLTETRNESLVRGGAYFEAAYANTNSDLIKYILANEKTNILKDHPDMVIKKITFDVATYTESYLSSFDYESYHKKPVLKLYFKSYLARNIIDTMFNGLDKKDELKWDKKTEIEIVIGELDVRKARKFTQTYNNELMLPTLYKYDGYYYYGGGGYVKIQDELRQTNYYPNFLWHFEYEFPNELSQKLKEYNFQGNEYYIILDGEFQSFSNFQNTISLPKKEMLEQKNLLKYDIQKFLDYCYSEKYKRIDVKKVSKLNKTADDIVIFNMKFYLSK